jgi:methionine synthase I (cobalamin-dependent)
MSDLLSDLLASRDYLLADGATGTNFFAMGLESGDAPDIWNIDHPDRVHALHRGFVEAGSDIILTNTFGANRHRLKLHGDQDRVAEINEAGAKIARLEADAAERPVVVAGSMGPTGEIYQPVGPLSIEEGEDAFEEQARALAAGGVDVLWIETISGIEEISAAVSGAARTGLPIVATMTFDTAGRTMMGITPEQAVEHTHGLDTRLVAFGANCGIGPGTLVDTVLGLGRGTRDGDILIAKGNCGIPEYKDGEIVYSGSLDVMAQYARLARDAGARIIGGCCGTSPDHVKAMADALKNYVPAAQPEREQIEAALGPIAPKAPEMVDDGEKKGRRSGRRRRV